MATHWFQCGRSVPDRRRSTESPDLIQSCFNKLPLPNCVKKFFLFIAIMMAGNFSCFAQIVMSDGTVNTCNNVFTDTGGEFGNYLEAIAPTQTLVPATPGTKIRVVFQSFATVAGWDMLYIYNGPDFDAPLIGSYSGTNSPGEIISTAPGGELTFFFAACQGCTDFMPNYVPLAGWKANVSCIEYHTMSPDPANSCSGLFTDSGGHSSGYSNNEDIVKTFYPTSGRMRITFESFDLENGQDFLYAYNGVDINAPLLGVYTGTTLPPDLYSSTGPLTIRFTSNCCTTSAGWRANISCLQSQSMTSGNVVTCGKIFTDTNAISGFYNANENITLTFTPDVAGLKIKVAFDFFAVDFFGDDYLEIFDGPGTGSPQLGRFSDYDYEGGYPADILSSAPGGQLTFRFHSDNDAQTGEGWSANITCATSPTPVISSFSPSSASVDEIVNITGANFGTTPANNIVRFNGSAGTITGGSPTSLNVVVPPNATTGKVTVELSGKVGTSGSNFVFTPLLTAQPSNLSFTSVSTSSIGASFSAAPNSPSGYLVLRKTLSSPTDVPVDGTIYTAGNLLGSSSIVYSGPATSFTDTQLDILTHYFYKIYAYKASATNVRRYLTSSPLQGSRSTITSEPTAQPSSLTFTDVAATAMTVSFQNAAIIPTGYIAVYKDGTTLPDTPDDGVGYVAGDGVGSGSVAYIGAANSFTLSNLTPDTNYSFKVFSYNGSGATSNYLTLSPLAGSRSTLGQQPLAQVSSVSTGSISTQNVTITYPSSGADRVIALRFQGASPSVLPADGVDYTVGSILGNSTVAYSGAALSFQDMTLAPGTGYSYVVLSANGDGLASNYLTSISSSNSVSMVTLPIAPTATASSNLASNSFTANWSSVTGAVSYELDVSKNDFETLIDGMPQTGIVNTQFTVNELDPSTSYQYRVRAVNAANGKSANSNTAPALTTQDQSLSISTDPLSSTALTGFNKKTITVQISGGTGSKTLVMKYKGILSETFNIASATPLSASQFEAEITESMMDELGVEYYFEATDANTTIKQSANSYLYKSIPASSNIPIPFNSGFDGKTSTYQMFSVPYQLADESISNIFDPFLGGQSKKKWRLFHYQNEVFDEYPEVIKKIELGKGYWFNTIVESAPITIGQAAVFQANNAVSFSLSFDRGWNQIGDPYPFNLDWNAIQQANEAAGLNSLWGYEAGTPVKRTVLESWKGAFVFSDNGGTVSFPISAKTTATGRTKGDDFSRIIDESTWKFTFSLNVGNLEHAGAIGMHPLAKHSKDKFDEITLPRFADFVEMNSAHPEFFAPDFSMDIVPTSGTYQWEFKLESNQPTHIATLTWDQLPLKESESTLILIDTYNQSWLDMKEAGEYEFEFRDGGQLSLVYTGKGEPFEPHLSMAGNAYPNPFNDVITFPILSTSATRNIQLQIYDMTGKHLATLQKSNTNAGISNIVWDGKDNQGNDVSPGLLFYRCIFDDASTQVRRIIKTGY